MVSLLAGTCTREQREQEQCLLMQAGSSVMCAGSAALALCVVCLCASDAVNKAAPHIDARRCIIKLNLYSIVAHSAEPVDLLGPLLGQVCAMD